jgi:uncharacterized protein (TIGR03437 family)
MHVSHIGLSLILSISSTFAAPVIVGAVNGASYQPTIASATWVAIVGSNLSTVTRQWADSDFLNGNLPTKLGDVQVTINGKSAFIYFISTGQINVLAPDDPTIGQVPVQVTNSQGSSNLLLIRQKNLWARIGSGSLASE